MTEQIMDTNTQQTLSQVDNSNDVLRGTSEKMLSQSEVNKLIADQKREAYQKGLSEGQQHKSPESNQHSSIDENRLSSLVETQTQKIISQLVADEKKKAEAFEKDKSDKLFQEQLIAKVNEAASKIPDYNEVVGEIDYVNNAPHVLAYANLVPNGGECLYYLAQKENIDILSRISSLPPGLAAREMQALSVSITNNQLSQHKVSPAPLSQIKASTVKADSGKLTPEQRLEMAKQSWRV